MNTQLHELVSFSCLYEKPVNPAQLAHEFCQPWQRFLDTELLHAANAFTLKAKLLSLSISTLTACVVQALAKHKDGTYFIVARLASAEPPLATAADNIEAQPTALINALREAAPGTVTRDNLASMWSDDLIALPCRQGLGESLQRHVDISWFIRSQVKYHKLFGKVFIESFFLQLFALVTPLFIRCRWICIVGHSGLKKAPSPNKYNDCTHQKAAEYWSIRLTWR
jgi:subfamily B ATP-binding cassette protein HlyB/CyaB